MKCSTLPRRKPKEQASESINIPIGTAMGDAERDLIKATLLHTGSNKTKTAKILGIGTRTLYRKIEEYDL